MLLCLALDVSPSAVKVASAIASHGWNSWPSRETLCRLTDLKSPNVSRATKELEEAGFIARRRKYHKGGNVGIQYTFNGLAIAAAAVEQEHPTLGDAIINLIPEPEDRTGREDTFIDYQSNSGSGDFKNDVLGQSDAREGDLSGLRFVRLRSAGLRQPRPDCCASSNAARGGAMATLVQGPDREGRPQHTARVPVAQRGPDVGELV